MAGALDFDLDEAIRIRDERRARTQDLLAFTHHTKPNYLAGWFHRELAEKLTAFLWACMRRESPRLMVLAPPRHGKSELISRRFPAFALGHCPDFEIIGASYAMTLAERMNRDVQRIIDSKAYAEAFPATRIPERGKPNREGKTRNNDLVEVLGKAGSYRAAGARVGISGMGMHIGLIDDPIKDAKEASSQTIRDDVWDWYVSTFYSRLAPGGGILIVQTRWHEDDLAGRLIAASERARKGEDEDADVFEVIEYPAIATKDEAHRKEGEALHPERYDIAALRRIRKVVGTYYWAALYQQKPAPAEGDVFRSAWWKFWRALPPIQMVRLYADTALKTKEANDFSVFQAWGLGSDGRIYLLDQVRGKWESPELKHQAVAFWSKWSGQPMGEFVPPAISFSIEDKASGTGLVQSLQRETAIPVIPIPRDTDKLVRARSGAPSIEAGNVWLPDPIAQPTEWLADYLAEFASFTAAMSHSFDDQIDPTLDAIHDLILGTMDFYGRALD